MLRRLSIFVLAMLMSLSICGCKDDGAEEVEVKSPAELKAEAEKEINEENMDAELEKLEEAIEAETN